MENAKNILKSKTFWFNLAVAIYGVLQTSGLVTAIPEPFGALLVGGGNIGLRVLTTQPVTVKPGTPTTVTPPAPTD